MKFPILTLALCTLLLASCHSPSEKLPGSLREHQSFNQDWLFHPGDSEGDLDTDRKADAGAAGIAYRFADPDHDDGNWRRLDLPHDWSIEGEFSREHPAGIGGGALPGGVGWYRKQFSLAAEDSALMHFITFDGIYQNSEVWINGHYLGKRPFGYISFRYDLTPYLVFGGVNTLAVRADNSDQPNSRWYSGSGIYRNIWYTKTHPVHFALWGSYVETPEVTKERAAGSLELSLNNESGKEQELLVETRLLDADGKTASKSRNALHVRAGEEARILQEFELENPELWSVERPYLYTAHSRIFIDGKAVDHYETPVGLRWYEFHPDSGFILNGEQVKIKGVCMHHDLGALGAAFNYRARERQLEILKEMGCNGIRTAHNPPEPELLELCDRMGFIVQNETFDVWRKSKVKNDYAKYFDEWHERDLVDHLKRDRNHPSIFSWSIGNEILEQWDSSGTALASRLAGIAREYIPNIPLTGGFNDPEPYNHIIRSGELDLIGFNYKHERFEAFQETFPGGRFIATETTSSLNSRGEYDLPSDSIRRWPVRWDIPFYDGMDDNRCSSYDNCSAPWGSTHAESWKLIKKHDFLSGMYIWTGFDYLGEPTPYQWPSRSSYFGIVDLAGFPKDAYFMYQAEWTDKPVLHLFPHWNWEEGQEVDVWAYTSYNEVELFLNGRSLGTKQKEGDALHLQWRVPFEPGELKAIGRGSDPGTDPGGGGNGKASDAAGDQRDESSGQADEIREVVIRTAGRAARIELAADRAEITADGKDLSFVTVKILDRDGNLVPGAKNLLHFELQGPGSIAAVDNGEQTSHEPFQASYRRAYNGKCLVVIRSDRAAGIQAGEIRLRALSAELEAAEIIITSKPESVH